MFMMMMMMMLLIIYKLLNNEWQDAIIKRPFFQKTVPLFRTISCSFDI